MKIVECPVCGADKNSYGKDFGNLRALSLHMAAKARNWNDSNHWDWVRKLLPDDTNVRDCSINYIDNQIRPHVWEALEELEPEEVILEEDGDVQEEEEEKEPYLRAYAHFWEIETKLHRFAALRLAAKYGNDWWKAFPVNLQR